MAELGTQEIFKPQSKQRGQLGKNFGYAIWGLIIVVSGPSSSWQHGDPF